MTREATKKKRDKKRAQKKKHEHQTEHMAEEAAKEKRLHKEEIIAIVVLLLFVPFMVTGIIWWPASTGTGKATGGTGLADGRYSAEYLGSRTASDGDAAVAVLDVAGESVFVDEQDLSGKASKDSTTFLEGQRGELIEITVKNGFIIDWEPAP
jgi:hypothetical protein